LARERARLWLDSTSLLVLLFVLVSAVSGGTSSKGPLVGLSHPLVKL